MEPQCVYTVPNGTVTRLGCELALGPTLDLASAPTNFGSHGIRPEAWWEPCAECRQPRCVHRGPCLSQSPPVASPPQVREPGRTEDEKEQPDPMPVLAEKPCRRRRSKQLLKAIYILKTLSFKEKKKNCNETLLWKIDEVASSNYRSVQICVFHWALIYINYLSSPVMLCAQNHLGLGALMCSFKGTGYRFHSENVPSLMTDMETKNKPLGSKSTRSFR